MRLSSLVRRVVAPNPSMLTGRGTNTYLVGAGDVAIIDPGPDDARHVNALRDALSGERVTAILLTHTHPDHAPAASGLSRATGAPVRAFIPQGRPAAPATLPGVAVQPLQDGEIVAAAGVTLRALYTPGHASDHVCFLLEEEPALFSGDLINSGTTVLIAPPDGDMAVYMHSLERLRGFALARIYPGHGDIIERPAAVIEEYLQHRRVRERQIADALRDGPARIPNLVRRIYMDVPEALHRYAAQSVYSHLIKLRDEGKVTGHDLESEWRLT